MTLLRDVLEKNSLEKFGLHKSPRTQPRSEHTQSFVAVHSPCDLITSPRPTVGAPCFVDAVRSSGVTKRRRPEVSCLGVPKWYHFDPPESPHMPGTESVQGSTHQITAACGHSMNPKENPWLSVVLYHYGPEGSKQAMYHEGGLYLLAKAVDCLLMQFLH